MRICDKCARSRQVQYLCCWRALIVPDFVSGCQGCNEDFAAQACRLLLIIHFTGRTYYTMRYLHDSSLSNFTVLPHMSSVESC